MATTKTKKAPVARKKATVRRPTHIAVAIHKAVKTIINHSESEILDNVAKPATFNKPARKKYMFDIMQVGQCMQVPLKSRGGALSALNKYKKEVPETEWTYASDKDKFRIWRDA